jgi:riboflavin kinase/FMN adenylyltransferase
VVTKLIRGLYNKNFDKRGSVLAIGNFDGIHLGHQALIKQIKMSAKELGVPSIVMTFEPQPLEFFAPERKVPRLTRFREKFSLLSKADVDQVWVVRFNTKVAALSADAFIKKILLEKLHVKQIIVGKDFRFGQGREGNIDLLRKAGELYGFTVKVMPDVMIDNERVSSTRVRKALVENNLVLAETLLGRPYSLMGKVVYGNQLGRRLGFPTANIFLHRAATPVHGIYVVLVHGLKNKPLQGVANVGIRPTIGGTRIILEVYLFDFKETIYGKVVSVEFCKKLREEERYDNLEQLKIQMEKDALQAREYFSISLNDKCV